MMTRSCWLLLCATACAPATRPPGPVPQPTTPVVRLEPRATRAIAELLEIQDRRALDIDRLTRHAVHPLPAVREHAALAAGRVADRAALPVLLDLLNDGMACVRANAAFALGLLADTTAVATAALAGRVAEALASRETGHALTGHTADEATCLAHTEPVEALFALGRIGTPAAARAVHAVVARGASEAGGGLPPILLGEALLATWRLPADAAVIANVSALTRSADPALRWKATYALMRLGSPLGGEALLDRLADTDPLTRVQAARGLRAPLADSAGLRAAAREALQRALADPHPHVRIAAARTLPGYRDEELVLPLAGLLADPDSNVVLATAEALAALGAPALATLRQVAADHDAGLAVRAAALAGLLRHDPAHARTIAAAWAEAPDWLSRVYAARAAAAGTWNAVADVLAQLLRDPDGRVAATAAAGIATLAPDDERRSMLTEALAVSDPFVRAAALRGFQRRVEPGDMPLLLMAYGVALDDPVADAAIASIDALAALAGQGVAVQRAFFARFAVPPAHPVVRRHAVQRLGPGRWGGWAPIETGRDIDWYMDIVARYVAPALAGERLPRALIDGPNGVITIELLAADAPLTVHNFVSLAERGYFDRHAERDAPPRWHRVVPGFVLQDGDPRGDGLGGPGHVIRDELNAVRYTRGTVGMALSGPDTGGSQFFITLAPQPHLDGAYTVFGRVIDGMEVADAVLQDDAIAAILIERPASMRGTH